MKKTILCFFLILSLLSLPAFASESRSVGVVLDELSASDARCRECSLGDYTADAIRDALGSELAVIPGSMLSGDLAYGSVTEDDVTGLFVSDERLAMISVSPQVLKDLLERSVAAIALSEDEVIDPIQSASEAFMQISGFRYVYNPEAEPGSRIMSVTLEDSREVDFSDESASYILAGPISVLEGTIESYDLSGSVSKLTLTDAFISYIGTNGTQPQKLNRIRAAGTAENKIISLVPGSLLWAAVAIFALFGVISPVFTREKKTENYLRRSRVFAKDYFYN